ncbi:hypothetical protein HanRHA438_Chr16g0758701 [Helianthus annuus]|nr:hypothetical protein HanRHA438_Chr16g0758701 [Helianthus annuus]
MSDRSIGCCEPHTWASVWLHVVTMSFRRKDRKLSMDLAGIGISSHVKYKDVIHGFWFWPVCLNPGRDTSSKLGLQLLSLTST